MRDTSSSILEYGSVFELRDSFGDTYTPSQRNAEKHLLMHEHRAVSFIRNGDTGVALSITNYCSKNITITASFIRSD